MMQLARMVKGHDGPLLVIGDFNMTPWTSHFKDFMEEAALYDGRRGKGILPTWPAALLPMQIPIDHIVVNDGLEIIEMAISDGLASDHRTLWADLR